MRLYLTSPPGMNMADTKWLLTQRGYSVVTDQDMLSPKYVYNFGITPSANDVKRLRVLAMIDADAVVLHDTTPSADRLHHEYLCRTTGIPAVLHHTLPAQCPNASRELEILEALNIIRPLPAPLGQRLRKRLAPLTGPLARVARSFLDRTASLLSKGRRQQRRRASKPYPLPSDHITTTS